MVTASFTCENPEETRRLGELIGRLARPGEIWSLSGPLGAGKTLLIQGMARGLGFPGTATSPTFTLQHVYEGRLNLYHFDWYRLTHPREVEELGWAEWADRGGVVAVEWGDKFPQLLPPATIKLGLEFADVEGRRVTVEATHPESIPRVEELIRCWPP